ncbi:MAG: transporter substrate-binding domain-containing protein [Pseudomonadota bacterium]
MKFAIALTILLISRPAVAKDLLFLGQDFPPFNWAEAGVVKGAMVDVMKTACEKLRHNCKFAIVPLARGLRMLEAGTADGVMTLIPNAERAVYANFSPAIAATKLTYFGLKGKLNKADSLNDLEGWTVGAVRASTSLQIAIQNQKQLKAMNIIEESHNRQMILKLQAGRYGEKGAIFGSEAVLEFEARKQQVALEAILMDTNQGYANGFTTAFSKKSMDAKIVADFANTLEAMKKNGEVKLILEKFDLKTK